MIDASGLRDMPLAGIEAARERIFGHVIRTPMLASRTAARWLGDAGGARISDGPSSDGQARLFMKAEHLQVTGSFKTRGATNRVLQLTGDERARGLITISAGNHAQALAYAASSAGVPVTVCMPEGASRAKADAAAGYGAEVILVGAHVGETIARMEELREERGLTFVPPFDDPAIIAGQGTVGWEIVDDLPDVDVVVVGVGGGGLISGISSAVKQRRPNARVIGIEPEQSNALTLGLAAGSPVTIKPMSIADGLGAPFAGSWTIDIARRYVDDILLVDEATIITGLRFALERMKQLLEPAGATALGAVLAGIVPLRDGETVCVVASGGNISLDRLTELLSAG